MFRLATTKAPLANVKYKASIYYKKSEKEH